MSYVCFEKFSKAIVYQCMTRSQANYATVFLKDISWHSNLCLLFFFIRYADNIVSIGNDQKRIFFYSP